MQHKPTSMQQCMMIISDCLLKLGYRKLAIQAQRSEYWEFALDYVVYIIREARRRKDYGIIARLYSANLYVQGCAL